MTLLADLASDATLDATFAWLCKRRREYPDDADVWDFRRHWPVEKARLQSDLSAGRCHFGPAGLSVATKTIERFVARAIRLYEQELEEACASARLGSYVRRWVRWAGSALPPEATTGRLTHHDGLPVASAPLMDYERRREPCGGFLYCNTGVA